MPPTTDRSNEGAGEPAKDEETGLKGLRSWRSVYVFVVVVVAVWMALLFALTRKFS